ncbi:MAG: gluconate 2-dehydrogenase subunit 3 family protein [Gemmatimonadales bacterium]
MQRRELLRSLGALALPALVPLPAGDRWELGRAIHRTVQGTSLRVLDRAQAALATALADTILPRTDTPGALDAGAVEFLDRLLADWHTDTERQDFLTGLNALDARCRQAMGVSFAELDGARRAEFLTPVDAAEAGRDATTPEAAYARLKSTVVFAFLTSRAVREGVLRTPIIPGRFDGCIPAPAGD